MNWFELILLIVGFAIFVASFFIPERNTMKTTDLRQQEELTTKMVEKELLTAQEAIKDTAEETVAYTVEKTERALDRLANEKMLAIGEYSDTVLGEIQKNHDEAVFLYSMLNDKHNNVKNTVLTAEMAAKEVKEVAKTAEEVTKAAKEAAKKIEKKAVPGQDEIKVQSPSKEQSVKEIEKKETSTPDDLPMSPASARGKNNNERILQMHKKGKSNIAIARELGLGIGEVKLVIDLFKQA